MWYTSSLRQLIMDAHVTVSHDARIAAGAPAGHVQGRGRVDGWVHGLPAQAQLLRGDGRGARAIRPAARPDRAAQGKPYGGCRYVGS